MYLFVYKYLPSKEMHIPFYWYFFACVYYNVRFFGNGYTVKKERNNEVDPVQCGPILSTPTPDCHKFKLHKGNREGRLEGRNIQL